MNFFFNYFDSFFRYICNSRNTFLKTNNNLKRIKAIYITHNIYAHFAILIVIEFKKHFEHFKLFRNY